MVLAVSGGAPAAVNLALRHAERVPALVLVVPALHVPTEPSATGGSGPPSFVVDYVLGSDLLAAGIQAPEVVTRSPA